MSSRALALTGAIAALALACSDPEPEPPLTGPQTAAPGAVAPPAPGAPAAPAADRPSEFPPRQAPTPEEIARAAAPAVALAPPETDWAGGNATQGHELYNLYCMMCHGPDGKGDGPAAAGLNPKPRDFTSGAFTFDANANNRTGEPIDLARVIREGPATFGGSAAMPRWKETFSETQVRDLVAYVQQLTGARTGG